MIGIVITVIIFGLLIAEIYLQNKLAIEGPKYLKVQEDIKELQTENQLLEDQIADAESLKEIEPKAKALGFQSVEHIEYITSPTPIPQESSEVSDTEWFDNLPAMFKVISGATTVLIVVGIFLLISQVKP